MDTVKNLDAENPTSISVGNEKISHLRALIQEHGVAGWEETWKNKVTPWDAGKPQPALRALLESSELPLPTSGRALVPGCGRAYDAITIASVLGLQTLAVDISTTAVEAAKDLLLSSPEVPIGKISIQLVDFFAFEVPEDERFDLIYDYTFFVALPPTSRNDWGRKMTALAKPGAYLVTLVFPLGLSPSEGGPPFYVIPEHYDGPLEGWKKVLDKIPEVEEAGMRDKQRLVVWRKE
ncbi:S-adenosyl-L-methionine-dependent methyltransferase [Amylostereum chailletii]|nr:S-adenosyl-L-methionine-dependent methyltransferase [Amylostereum chailletii]